MIETVEFTEEEVKKYLDQSIRYWRKNKETYIGDPLKPICYIDAYQSVRVSLFGRMLPMKNPDKNPDKVSECESNGCGGFKHCIDRGFDSKMDDCKECARDASEALKQECGRTLE